MFRLLGFIVLALFWGVQAAHANPYGTPRLEIVAQLKERPGNVAVAPDGRVFISMHPFDNPVHKVMEVAPDGTTKPFPNEAWSREPGRDGVGLANVIHLAVLGKNLYILDMGSDTVTPKLLAWDLAGNALKQIWYIPKHATTKQSFLQDFVITPDATYAIIADMGQADLLGQPSPALVVLNLQTGVAVRKLVDHPSVRPNQKQMMAGGTPLRLTRGGKDYALMLGLNPITMDPRGAFLYYAPMSEGLIYRVAVADVVNPSLTPEVLAAKISVVGPKPASDGMIVDHAENIFIGSVNTSSVGVINNKGKYTSWLRDTMLSWVDGFAFGPENTIYATVNQLHLAGIFHRGEDKSIPPYLVVRIVGGRPVPAQAKSF